MKIKTSELTGPALEYLTRLHWHICTVELIVVNKTTTAIPEELV